MRIEEAIKQKQFKNEYHRAVVNLIYTSNWFQSEQARFFKQYGISSQQYNILRILRGQHPKPCTINLLTERMLDKNSNASRLVEKLKQKNYLERVECATDRRQVDITITELGLKVLAEIDPFQNHEQDISKNLSPDEANQLSNLLDKFRG